MDESRYLYGKSATDRDEDDLREVKVKLPVRQVVALHGMKILQGKNVSEIVSMALERYLEGGRNPLAETRTAEAAAGAASTA